jgi:DNA polymerase III subunit gamma/tau
MSYTVIARRYRPQKFDEVIGQQHVTTTLQNAIRSDRVHHAYLFTGPRGVGKTSTARILAKALCCEKGKAHEPCNRCETCQEISQSRSLNVLEIDGASNRGIDEIRALRENVKYAPAGGRFKIYIIDEVHQITRDAFNALLKTLEEPPAHVRFIFATTEPHRVPATILSRCQRFDFRLVDSADIVKLLKGITKKEKLKIEEAALYRIARAARGSIRDGQSILDQLSNFSEGVIQPADVNSLLGLLDTDFWFRFLTAIKDRKVTRAWGEIDKVIKEGVDLFQFASGLAEFLRDLLIARLGQSTRPLLDMPHDEAESLMKFAQGFSDSSLIKMIDLVGETEASMRRALAPRIAVEVLAVKLVRGEGSVSIDEILDRIETGEESFKGSPPPSQSVPGGKVVPRKKEFVEANSTDQAEAVKGSTLDPSEVNRCWPQVVKKTKAKKMSAGTFLEEGRLISVAGRKIKIAFPKGLLFHKETLEQSENMAHVRGSVESFLGKPVQIELVIQELSNSGEAPADEGTPPIVESALEIFGGRVISKGHAS